MFGRSKPVVFDRYASRQSRRLLPNWLWVLLCGVAIGAGALFYVLENLMPPRLSADATIRLREAFDSATQERSRLATELAQTRKELEETLARNERVSDELKVSQRNLGVQHDDIEALLAALPADPRGGVVEIRAVRFAVDGDALGYDMVFASDRAQSASLAGVMELHVAGKTAGGTETTVSLDPVTVKVGQYAIVHGSVPMPGGFAPRQVTIRVLDRLGGKLYGMRVINVK